MKRHILLIGLLVSTWGCAPSHGPGVQLYRPGRTLLLVFRTKLLDDGTSGSVSYIGDELVEHKETKGSSVMWTELELPLKVGVSGRLGCAAVSMKLRRMRTSSSYRNEEGDSSDESSDTAKPPSGDANAQREHRAEVVAMQAISFHALVNGAGEVVDYDARGGFFDEMKEQWSTDGIPHDMKKTALRTHTLGVFSALSCAAAYLPPDDPNVGQQWAVRRGKVFPFQWYAFYMFTNGCQFASERSTCTVKAIKQTPAGRVATIEIVGRRIPRDPEKGMPRRVEYLTVSGQLRFNLDTKEVMNLRIESTARFIEAEDKRKFAITFVDTVALRRQR